MRIELLLIILSSLSVSLPSFAEKSKKRVHIVAGSTSGRTQINGHPLKQKITVSAVYYGCDQNPTAEKFYFSRKDSVCRKDVSTSPSHFKGNTLGVTLRYREEGSFNKNCDNPKATRFTLSQVLTPDRARGKKSKELGTYFKDAAKRCGAQNLAIQGESDTKAILGKNLKKLHRHYNTRRLDNPQTCDALDNFKQLNFEPLAPKFTKDRKKNLDKNGIYFRNGGFRIGEHTHYEYDAKSKRWYEKRYQQENILKGASFKRNHISRKQVMKEGTSDGVVNSEIKDPSSLRPLPIIENRDGQLFLKGSITLLPDGRASINPINQSLNVDYNAMKRTAIDHTKATLKSKGVKPTKANVRKIYLKKMEELSAKVKARLTLKQLNARDKTKGHILMQFKEDKHGVRTSTVSTYDGKDNHLRTIQLSPTNVLGQKMKKQNSWCGEENCLLMSTNKDQLSQLIYKSLGLGNKSRVEKLGLDAGVTCSKNAGNSLDMTGGHNTCMSCFGITPGVCGDKEISDDGFNYLTEKTANGKTATKRDPKDNILGKKDPIELLVKQRYAESKGALCERRPSPAPPGVIKKVPQQTEEEIYGIEI